MLIPNKVQFDLSGEAVHSHLTTGNVPVDTDYHGIRASDGRPRQPSKSGSRKFARYPRGVCEHEWAHLTQRIMSFQRICSTSAEMVDSTMKVTLTAHAFLRTCTRSLEGMRGYWKSQEGAQVSRCKTGLRRILR